jgi:predicted house-cleaning NTP pyrophosphatase (Maf/HAM1 superfamily)
MLRLLSGQTHQVMTAVALADKQQTLDCMVVTEIFLTKQPPNPWIPYAPALSKGSPLAT